MSLLALVAAAVAASAAPTSGPPPATVVTATGTREMAISSYCWVEGRGGRCVDGFARGPLLRVADGERVVFHLGFRPDSVQLVTAGRRRARLPARRTITYRLHARDRYLHLFIRGGGGDVSYNAELLGPPPEIGIDPHPPPAHIVTERDTAWMATGAFCWRSACASSARMDIGPHLRLRAGEVVTVHVAFAPRRAAIRTANGTVRLEPGRRIRYRVRRGDEFLTLSLDAGPGESVSYGVRVAG